MTKQKNIGRILSVVLVVAMLLCALASCGENSKTGFATLVIGTEIPTEYKVNLDKVEGSDGLLSVLAYLKAEKGLAYTEAGGFLTAVGDLKQEGNRYIYLYTSVEEDFDVSEYKSTVEYKGQTLTSAGVGAKDMHVKDGAVIYIGTITFG